MKKLLGRIAAAAAAAVISLGVFTSCGLTFTDTGIGVTQTQLGTPDGLRVESGSLCWNPVEYASRYTVSIDGKEYYCEDYKYSLENVSDGEHIFKVKANGDGLAYTSSPFSESLTVTLENGAQVTTGYYGQFDELTKQESFLGYGFDVINSSSFSDKSIQLSSPIFKQEEIMKQRLVKVDAKYSTVNEMASSSMESFMQQWNANANVDVSWDGLFIGGSVQLEAAYSGGVENAKSKYFHCISFYNQKFYIVMQSDLDTYRSIVSDGFKKDLYSGMEPAVLFKRYGTHFITSAIMGGKINSYYLYTSEEEKSFQDISGKVSAEVRGWVVNTNVDVSGGYKQEEEKQNIKIDNSLEVIGGGDFGMKNDSDIAANYAAWEKSLNDHASVMGIKDAGSLWGIWDLIDPALDTERIYSYVEHTKDNKEILHTNCTRSEQLQGYFQTYGIDSYNSLMKAAGLPELEVPENLTDIRVNSKEAVNGEYTAYAGSNNNVSFVVEPSNATGYTKTVSLATVSDYATIGEDGMSVDISADCPNNTVLQLVLSAGAVRETIRVRVVRNYNVNFVLNGGTLTEEQIKSYTDLPYGTRVEMPPAPTRGAEYIFGGWYTDMNFNTPYEERAVTEDFTLYAKWEKYYPTITFENAEGSDLKNVKVEYNTPLPQPKDPVLEGYAFGGFYADREMTMPFEFTQSITKDTNIYVKWNINSYTVTFETNGGNEVESQTVEYNSKITYPATPKKTGYEFGNWYKDAALTDIFDFYNDVITKDITLYAEWLSYPVEIVFDSQGGNEIEAQRIESNSAIGSLPTPVRTGYKFLDWYTAPEKGEKVYSTTIFTENTTLYARWTTYPVEIVFDSQGGDEISSQTIESNLAIGELPTPVRTGYQFLGWYTENDEEVSATKIFTEDTTLYAQWEANTYTVTFNLSQSDLKTEITCDKKSINISYAEIKTLPVPKAQYYNFVGWYTEEGIPVTDKNGSFLENCEGYTDFSGKWFRTENATLYAQWEQEYANYTYISTPEELSAIANNTTANYLIIKDIDCLGGSWTPISTFKGILEGDNHTISNISGTGIGFNSFGFVQKNEGTIKNLRLLNCSFLVAPKLLYRSETVYCGAICGSNSGTLENITVENCKVTANSTNIAIIFKEKTGMDSKDITQKGNQDLWTRWYLQSYLNVNKECDDGWFKEFSYRVYAGGIVGFNDLTGKISNCYVVEGTVESNVYHLSSGDNNYSVAGGVCGYNKGNIMNVTSSATVCAYADLGNSASGMGWVGDWYPTAYIYACGIAGLSSTTILDSGKKGSVSYRHYAPQYVFGAHFDTSTKSHSDNIHASPSATYIKG